MIYCKSMENIERLDKWINDIEAKLKKYPQGEIFVARNGKGFKWYYRETEDSERRAISFYLRHHQKRPWKSERLLADNPGYQELLLPAYRPVSERLAEWAKEPYQKCEKEPEKLTVRIPDGSFVRSKSEALIAMILFKYRIPFRYECALHLGDITYFPDFTIRHPKTGEVFYFEHFGLMDKKSYVLKTNRKLENYNLHGIIQSKNLITTYETKDRPLDVEYVEMLVKYYFL